MAASTPLMSSKNKAPLQFHHLVDAPIVKMMLRLNTIASTTGILFWNASINTLPKQIAPQVYSPRSLKPILHQRRRKFFGLILGWNLVSDLREMISTSLSPLGNSPITFLSVSLGVNFMLNFLLTTYLFYVLIGQHFCNFLGIGVFCYPPSLVI